MILPFRYVILSYPRSGTHMLRTALNEHSSLFVSDELTNRANLPDELKSCNLEQLLNYRFKDATNKIKIALLHVNVGAIGDDNILHSDWWKIFNYIVASPNIKVIVIRREAYLSRYVSHLIAGKNDVWRSETPVKNEEVVTVDPIAFVEDASRIDQLYRDKLGLLRGHTVFETTYEKLNYDWNSIMNMLFGLVGVNSKTVSPTIVKQETRPISDIVTNYSELQELFKDRQYLLK